MGGSRKKTRQSPSVKGNVFSSARFSGGGSEARGRMDGDGGGKRRKRRFGSEAERRSVAAMAEDVYEAEDVMAEEDKDANGGGRYDVVTNYEYEQPSDFEDDEDIDEQNVWTEEDRKAMGDNPFGLDAEHDEDNDDDDEEDEDGDEEDEDREEEEEEEEDEDGRMRDPQEDVLDAFDNLESDDDDDEEDEEDGGVSIRDALRATDRDRRGKKRKNIDVVSEVYPESHFNIDPSNYGGDDGGKLTIKDMTAAAMANTEGMGNNVGNTARALHKNLNKILGKGKKKSTSADAAEAVPLPSNIRARHDRQVGYEFTSKDVAMWQDMVKHNREARTIRFPKPSEIAAQPMASVAELSAVNPSASTRAGRSEFEKQVEDLLRDAGALTAKDIMKSEGEAFLKTDAAKDEADMRERQANLLKMRSLMFRHEIKAKRLKKIKSKEYRRKLKKAEKRKIEKEFENGEDGGLDLDDIADENPEYVHELSMKAERDRAIERISLKHSNSSRWARRIIKRGKSNPAHKEMQAALGEQLMLGRKKREGARALGRDGPDDSSSDDYDDGVDGDDDGMIDGRDDGAAALDDGDDVFPSKGLMSMTFMKRAIQKKRREVERETEEFENRLADGSDEDSDGLGAEDEDDAKPRPTSGRIRFGNASGKVKESQLGEDSDGEGDEANDPSPPVAIAGDPSSHADEDDGRDGNGGDIIGTTGAAAQPKRRKGVENGVQQSRPGAGSEKRDEGLPDGDCMGGGSENGDEDEKDDGALVELMHSSRGDSLRGDNANVDHQLQLVKEAFAGDDVADEFDELKQAEVDAELPAVEELNPLPGWGLWSDQQKKPKWMIKKEQEQKRNRKLVASRRADKGLKNVVISEKLNRRAAKYHADKLPFDCNSKQVYEASLSRTLAPELNTDTNFKAMSRPKVIKTTGAAIPTPQPSRKYAKVELPRGMKDSSQFVVNPLASMSQRKGVSVKKKSKR